MTPRLGLSGWRFAAFGRTPHYANTDMIFNSKHPFQQLLDSRIAIIDGAMGTTIRTYGMTEADIRGERCHRLWQG